MRLVMAHGAQGHEVARLVAATFGVGHDMMDSEALGPALARLAPSVCALEDIGHGLAWGVASGAACPLPSVLSAMAALN
jgi:hypothetical protein